MIPWSSARVLVTGGAGFIGSHLVERLVQIGSTVAVVDKFTTGSRASLADVIESVRVLDSDIEGIEWREVLERESCDIIFHMAGTAFVPFSVESPGLDFGANLQATFRLLEAIRDVGWPGAILFPSSAAVYGNPRHTPIHEDDPTVPISPYGVSKLAAERYLAVFSQLYGIRGASVRPFSAYGPRQRKLVVYDLIQRIRANPAELFIYGDGSQVRDFVHVDDVVAALIYVAKHAPLAGEVYNVASGSECSIGSLVAMLCEMLDVEPRLNYSGAVRQGEPERWVVSIDRLRALGFEPSVPIREGLKKTIEWCQKEPLPTGAAVQRAGNSAEGSRNTSR